MSNLVSSYIQYPNQCVHTVNRSQKQCTYLHQIKLTGNICTPLHVCRLCCDLDVYTNGLETEAQSLFQIFLMYQWTGDRGPIIISDLLDVPMDWRQRHGEEWYCNNQYERHRHFFLGDVQFNNCLICVFWVWAGASELRW